jgi:3-hydroxy-3-methylglutaryl CoA synthase
MAEYASFSILKQEWRDLPRWKQIEAEMRAFARCLLRPNEYHAKDATFGKKSSKKRQFVDAYNNKVKDSTTISRQVGNIYTGSLYLELVSLSELHKLAPGERTKISLKDYETFHDILDPAEEFALIGVDAYG